MTDLTYAVGAPIEIVTEMADNYHPDLDLYVTTVTSLDMFGASVVSGCAI